MHAMPLYPALEPFATHMLNVGDGHTLYIEQSGNPTGIPVVCLHGGPGSGSSPSARQRFNPELYHIVVFDQRGAGRSTQAQGDVLHANTTPHLVADMEKIRTHLNIESWALYGSSWGSTLALAYALAHPERVKAMLIGGIYFCSEDELEWMFGPRGMADLRPQEYADMQALMGPLTGKPLAEALLAATRGPEPMATQAATAFGMYEGMAMTLAPDEALCREFVEGPDGLTAAQIELGYMVNNGFMPAGWWEAIPAKLAHIPTYILQGTMDLVCPLRYALQLKALMPHATLQMVLSGHWGNETMDDARVVVTDTLATLLKP